jgi:hypothetical protein
MLRSGHALEPDPSSSVRRGVLAAERERPDLDRHQHAKRGEGMPAGIGLPGDAVLAQRDARGGKGGLNLTHEIPLRS